MSKFNQEKMAEIRQELINSVYIPAFVQMVNEKAAAAGLGNVINSDDDLRKALEMTQVIEDNEKQSAASALDFTHNLMFNKQASVNAREQNLTKFASEAAKNLNLAEKFANAVEAPAAK